MKLFLPDNIYSSILESVLPKDSQMEIIKTESALLAKQLENYTSAIALVPSLEIINHRTFFVSSKVALTFDGILSNSYFYFQVSEREIGNVFMRGDLSINEVILAKILFKERYSSNIEFKIDISKEINKEQDYFVVGNENYISWDIKNGISFSDQVAETLNLPYVNYIIVSKDKEQLEAFNKLSDNIDSVIEDNLENSISMLGLKPEIERLIKENINSIYFELTQNELDSVNELIKLIYYHGIIDDMFDVKFI